ncbi:14-3-3 protein gamma-B-like [Dermatophagoides farinae]|uniref:14-3-3 family protein artA-like n=1 Tax=Dermatophagoides pteronyssinus TaxID=6956 RepID=A0A6P6YDU3_DERPT|nr:14-3-3 family protein artA-like [Dermatophagoides pteronyssinus]
MSDEVNSLIIKAKIAEQAERYDEMKEFMKSVVKIHKYQLSLEERNLLSVAFKNSVGFRRSSLRVINTIAKQQQKRNPEMNMDIINEYEKTVINELSEICHEIINLLDNEILSDDSKLNTEAKVFFWKMKADYFRYLAEFTSGEEHTKSSEASAKAYKEATELAEELPTTNPVRLGLALNYSVFYYEIANNQTEACQIAKNAFDNAISQLETVQDDTYRDSTLIMQLLRDNLTLWSSEQDSKVEKSSPESKKD